MDFKAMFGSIKDFLNLPNYMKIIIGIFISSSIFIFPSLSNEVIFKGLVLFGLFLILMGLSTIFNNYYQIRKVIRRLDRSERMLLTVCYLLGNQYFWINPGLEPNSFHVTASSKLEDNGVVEQRNCDYFYVLDKYWDRFHKKDLLMPRIDSIDDIKKYNECLLDMGDYQIIRRGKKLIPVIASEFIFNEDDKEYLAAKNTIYNTKGKKMY